MTVLAYICVMFPIAVFIFICAGGIRDWKGGLAGLLVAVVIIALSAILVSMFVWGATYLIGSGGPPEELTHYP